MILVISVLDFGFENLHLAWPQFFLVKKQRNWKEKNKDQVLVSFKGNDKNF